MCLGLVGCFRKHDVLKRKSLFTEDKELVRDLLSRFFCSVPNVRTSFLTLLNVKPLVKNNKKMEETYEKTQANYLQKKKVDFKYIFLGSP